VIEEIIVDAIVEDDGFESFEELPKDSSIEQIQLKSEPEVKKPDHSSSPKVVAADTKEEPTKIDNTVEDNEGFDDFEDAAPTTIDKIAEDVEEAPKKSEIELERELKKDLP
jgi:hypothetical protein